MNTIIEITYKNYTENVIITNENHEEVVLMLATDKDVIDYRVVIDGDINFTDFNYELTMDLNGGKNVGVIRRLETTLWKMEQYRYFESNAQANKHFQKIEGLKKNILKRTSLLTKKESLFF